MLHAADGAFLDRGLVWQPAHEDNVIVREPREELPPPGVGVTEVAVLVAGGTTGAGYVPIASMQPAASPDGVAFTSQVVGLQPLLAVPASDVVGADGRILVDLLAKDGVRPFLNGENHLVWRDGEPIDPFVVSVRASAEGGGEVEFLRREVFNEGRSLREMDPLQRLNSGRGPTGFDGYASWPDWALAALSPRERALREGPRFPFRWLRDREAVLQTALADALTAPDPTREDVDAAVSYAERLRLVALPEGTTIGWLTILLHYGHTVSGEQPASAVDDPVLAALGSRLGFTLTAGGARRGEPNGRWLITYGKGVMDTDALSDAVFGELYVPLDVTVAAGERMRLDREWRFPAGMTDVLAAFACRFDAPFWARFTVDGGTRSSGTTVVDTLGEQEARRYTYTSTGLAGVEGFEGAFAVDAIPDGAVLTWSASWSAETGSAAVAALSFTAAAAGDMTAALQAHVTPG